MSANGRLTSGDNDTDAGGTERRLGASTTLRLDETGATARTAGAGAARTLRPMLTAGQGTAQSNDKTARARLMPLVCPPHRPPA